jgi:hypothetical protein
MQNSGLQLADFPGLDGVITDITNFKFSSLSDTQQSSIGDGGALRKLLKLHPSGERVPKDKKKSPSAGTAGNLSSSGPIDPEVSMHLC